MLATSIQECHRGRTIVCGGATLGCPLWSAHSHALFSARHFLFSLSLFFYLARCRLAGPRRNRSARSSKVPQKCRVSHIFGGGRAAQIFRSCFSRAFCCTSCTRILSLRFEFGRFLLFFSMEIPFFGVRLLGRAGVTTSL